MTPNVIAGTPNVLMWTDGVPVEAAAIQQLRNIASLPFIYRHVAVMPDVHVVDETPLAYKDIDAVMKAQEDLVSIKHTLRAVLCVKG